MEKNNLNQSNIVPARLLVVDDEPNIRTSIARALTLSGYTVDEADSGHKALNLLNQSKYALMVLDMNMPGLDGVQVMNSARKICPEISIIVLTGHPSVENAIAAVKLQAIDYLRKPAGIKEIVETVNRVLQERAVHRQQQDLLHYLGHAIDELRQTQSDSGVATEPEPVAEATQALHVPPVALDRHKLQVKIDGDSPRTAQLTEGEASVLAGLMARPNEVCSCSRLVFAAFGYESDSAEAESVIRPYIFRLRKKIGVDPQDPTLIRTVWKRGYLFSPDSNTPS